MCGPPHHNTHTHMEDAVTIHTDESIEVVLDNMSVAKWNTYKSVVVAARQKVVVAELERLGAVPEFDGWAAMYSALSVKRDDPCDDVKTTSRVEEWALKLTRTLSKHVLGSEAFRKRLMNDVIRPITEADDGFMKVAVPTLIRASMTEDSTEVVSAYMEKLVGVFYDESERSVPAVLNACLVFREYVVVPGIKVPDSVILSMCEFLLAKGVWVSDDKDGLLSLVSAVGGMLPFVYKVASVAVAGPVGKLTTRFVRSIVDNGLSKYYTSLVDGVHTAFVKWHAALVEDKSAERDAYDALVKENDTTRKRELENTPAPTYKRVDVEEETEYVYSEGEGEEED